MRHEPRSTPPSRPRLASLLRASSCAPTRRMRRRGAGWRRRRSSAHASSAPKPAAKPWTPRRRAHGGAPTTLLSPSGLTRGVGARRRRLEHLQRLLSEEPAESESPDAATARLEQRMAAKAKAERAVLVKAALRSLSQLRCYLVATLTGLRDADAPSSGPPCAHHADGGGGSERGGGRAGFEWDRNAHRWGYVSGRRDEAIRVQLVDDGLSKPWIVESLQPAPPAHPQLTPAPCSNSPSPPHARGYQSRSPAPSPRKLHRLQPMMLSPPPREAEQGATSPLPMVSPTPSTITVLRPQPARARPTHSTGDVPVPLVEVAAPAPADCRL